jgi:hypothetical protein
VLTTKYNKLLAVIFYGGIALLTSCGGLKVGLDDESLDAVECATGQRDCDDTTQNASSDSSDDSEEADTPEHTANYEGSNSDDETTGGGIEVIEPDGYNESEDRYFMGTYSEGSNSAVYSYSSQNCANQYNFPTVIRGYSHNDDNYIDFETNTGELAWVAEVYPDETFDFSMRFLDTFGHPSIEMDCTCEIVSGYSDYYSDEIQCSCASDEGACALAYTKM